MIRWMLRILIFGLLGVVAGGLIVTIAEGEEAQFCYDPYGTAVVPEFKATQTLIQVKWSGVPRGEEAGSSWYYDEETDTSICVMWVRMPEQILGDPDMDALGHEVLHCLTGDFHPENE